MSSRRIYSIICEIIIDNKLYEYSSGKTIVFEEVRKVFKPGKDAFGSISLNINEGVDFATFLGLVDVLKFWGYLTIFQTGHENDEESQLKKISDFEDKNKKLTERNIALETKQENHENEKASLEKDRDNLLEKLNNLLENQKEFSSNGDKLGDLAGRQQKNIENLNKMVKLKEEENKMHREKIQKLEHEKVEMSRKIPSEKLSEKKTVEGMLETFSEYEILDVPNEHSQIKSFKNPLESQMEEMKSQYEMKLKEKNDLLTNVVRELNKFKKIVKTKNGEEDESEEGDVSPEVDSKNPEISERRWETIAKRFKSLYEREKESNETVGVQGKKIEEFKKRYQDQNEEIRRNEGKYSLMNSTLLMKEKTIEANNTKLKKVSSELELKRSAIRRLQREKSTLAKEIEARKKNYAKMTERKNFYLEQYEQTKRDLAGSKGEHTKNDQIISQQVDKISDQQDELIQIKADRDAIEKFLRETRNLMEKEKRDYDKKYALVVKEKKKMSENQTNLLLKMSENQKKEITKIRKDCDKKVKELGEKKDTLIVEWCRAASNREAIINSLKLEKKKAEDHHTKQIVEMTKKCDSENSVIVSDFNTRLTSLRLRYDREIERIQTANQASIRIMKKEHTKEIRKYFEEYRELEKRTKAEIRKIKKEAKDELEKLEERFDGRIAQIVGAYHKASQEKEKLTKEMKEGHEIKVSLLQNKIEEYENKNESLERKHLREVGLLGKQLKDSEVNLFSIQKVLSEEQERVNELHQNLKGSNDNFTNILTANRKEHEREVIELKKKNETSTSKYRIMENEARKSNTINQVLNGKNKLLKEKLLEQKDMMDNFKSVNKRLQDHLTQESLKWVDKVEKMQELVFLKEGQLKSTNDKVTKLVGIGKRNEDVIRTMKEDVTSLRDEKQNMEEECRRLKEECRRLTSPYTNQVVPATVNTKIIGMFDEMDLLRSEYGKFEIEKLEDPKYEVYNMESKPPFSIGEGGRREVDEDCRIVLTLKLTVNNKKKRGDLISEGYDKDLKTRKLAVAVNGPVDRVMLKERVEIGKRAFKFPVHFKSVGKYEIRAFTEGGELDFRKVFFATQSKPDPKNSSVVVFCKHGTEANTPRIYRSNGEIEKELGGESSNRVGQLVPAKDGVVYKGDPIYVMVILRNKKKQPVKKRKVEIIFSHALNRIEAYRYTFKPIEWDENRQAYRIKKGLSLPVCGVYTIQVVDTILQTTIRVVESKRITIRLDGDADLVSNFPTLLSRNLHRLGILSDIYEPKIQLPQNTLPDIQLHLNSRSMTPLIDDGAVRGNMENLVQGTTTKSAIYTHLVSRMEVKKYVQTFGKIRDQDPHFPSVLFLGRFIPEELYDDVFFPMDDQKIIQSFPCYEEQMRQLVNLVKKVYDEVKKNPKRM